MGTGDEARSSGSQQGAPAEPRRASGSSDQRHPIAPQPEKPIAEELPPDPQQAGGTSWRSTLLWAGCATMTRLSLATRR